MKQYTIDLNYFDTENGQIIGDMGFYFNDTLNEELFTRTAKEMIQIFLNGFNSGYIGTDIQNPEIHNITAINNGTLGKVEISIIVLLQDQKPFEDKIRQMVCSQFGNPQINFFYR